MHMANIGAILGAAYLCYAEGYGVGWRAGVEAGAVDGMGAVNRLGLVRKFCVAIGIALQIPGVVLRLVSP